MARAPLAVVPAPVLRSVRPYAPGRIGGAIDLHLDANEAERPIVRVCAGTAPIHRYPDASRLEERLAALHGVSPTRVLVTAGADDALERALRAVCAPGREAIVTAPSFEMVTHYARLTGASVREVGWWRGEWPLGDVLAAASPSTATVVVVSPNNPTGAVISRAALERLAAALPRALVLLDHAYVEFADEDLTPAALAYPNVVVLRTFSKAWGAAGLRVGYALGDARVVSWLRTVGHPYPVAAPSLAAVERLLVARPWPRERIAAVRRRRELLITLLGRLGAETLPSQGNFVLARPASAERLRSGLARRGIAVRGFPDHPLLRSWVRITVPAGAAAWRRLERGLQEVLGKAGGQREGS